MLAAGWLGTLPGWLTLAVLIAGGFLAAKGSLGPALGYYREANDALTKENEALKRALADERKENAALRTKTDLEPMQRAILTSLTNHEERAATRNIAILNVLDMIAHRLGGNDDS